jgi:hypothetical protein
MIHEIYSNNCLPRHNHQHILTPCLRFLPPPPSTSSTARSATSTSTAKICSRITCSVRASIPSAQPAKKASSTTTPFATLVPRLHLASQNSDLQQHYVLSSRHHFCRVCEKSFKTSSGLRIVRSRLFHGWASPNVSPPAS